MLTSFCYPPIWSRLTGGHLHRLARTSAPQSDKGPALRAADWLVRAAHDSTPGQVPPCPDAERDIRRERPHLPVARVGTAVGNCRGNSDEVVAEGSSASRGVAIAGDLCATATRDMAAKSPTATALASTQAMSEVLSSDWGAPLLSPSQVSSRTSGCSPEVIRGRAAGTRRQSARRGRRLPTDRRGTRSRR